MKGNKISSYFSRICLKILTSYNSKLTQQYTFYLPKPPSKLKFGFEKQQKQIGPFW